MKRSELASFLTYLCLFFLPWQTVWIYDSVGDGEYGKLTHYAVQFLIVITALIRWEMQGNEPAKKILRRGLWFLAAIFLSCLLSINWHLSISFFFHLFSAGLLFWLLLDERIEIGKIIWFFSLGLIVPCLIGWWQVFSGWSPALTLFGLSEHLAATPGTSVVETVSARLMRAYGSFPHPNIFGGYLAAAILFVLGRIGWRDCETRNFASLRQFVPFVLLFLFVLSLVITFSRSAWLALAVGITVFLIGHVVVRKKISRKFLSGLMVVIAAVVISMAAFSGAVFTRLEAVDRLEEKSLSERQNEYQIIGEIIRTNPFVGVGPGAYTLVLEKLNPDQPVWSYQPMHNSFLLFFAETGLLGLVFLIYFLNALMPISTRTPVTKIIPLVATLTTLAFFDHYFWSQWAGLVLLVVIFVLILKILKEGCFDLT